MLLAQKRNSEETHEHKRTTSQCRAADSFALTFSSVNLLSHGLYGFDLDNANPERVSNIAIKNRVWTTQNVCCGPRDILQLQIFRKVEMLCNYLKI